MPGLAVRSFVHGALVRARRRRRCAGRRADRASPDRRVARVRHRVRARPLALVARGAGSRFGVVRRLDRADRVRRHDVDGAHRDARVEPRAAAARPPRARGPRGRPALRWTAPARDRHGHRGLRPCRRGVGAVVVRGAARPVPGVRGARRRRAPREWPAVRARRCAVRHGADAAPRRRPVASTADHRRRRIERGAGGGRRPGGLLEHDGQVRRRARGPARPPRGLERGRHCPGRVRGRRPTPSWRRSGPSHTRGP